MNEVPPLDLEEKTNKKKAEEDVDERLVTATTSPPNDTIDLATEHDADMKALVDEAKNKKRQAQGGDEEGGGRTVEGPEEEGGRRKTRRRKERKKRGDSLSRDIWRNVYRRSLTIKLSKRRS